MDRENVCADVGEEYVEFNKKKEEERIMKGKKVYMVVECGIEDCWHEGVFAERGEAFRVAYSKALEKGEGVWPKIEVYEGRYWIRSREEMIGGIRVEAEDDLRFEVLEYEVK